MSVGTGTVALSLGLCLCAGQLVATPAASAAPVVTAAAVKKVTPKISNSGSRTVKWGGTVKAVTRGSVRLQAKRGGKWHTWTAKKVSSKGTVTLVGKPGITTWFRTQYTGTSTYTWATSRALKVTVKASGAKVLAEAKRHKGAPYRFGASGPKRFDCSGYTLYVYRKAAGKKLPHKANSQQHYGSAVSKSKKKAGDLLVFRSGSYGTHVGIYAGGGYMWAAPHTGSSVKKQKVYSSNYVVRRLV
jgi:cell wall-associated NlpC family hydrolase